MSDSSLKCQNCESPGVDYYCIDCKMNFCSSCDADFHRPAKKRTHVRKAKFGGDTQDWLVKAEKEGKRSDYGSQKEEGKKILKYVLEYDEGYWYLFKNTSDNLHLDAELNLDLKNLSIAGFKADVRKLRVSLPPGTTNYVHLIRGNKEEECSCEMSQRFAIVPARPGKVPSVTPMIHLTASSPVAELRAQTEKEGTVSDHGSQDPTGVEILQFQWEFSGGYCFLWQNLTKDILFHKEIECELKNLEIVGKNGNKFEVDLKPGEEEFVIMKEKESNQAYGLAMKAGFSLEKIE